MRWRPKGPTAPSSLPAGQAVLTRPPVLAAPQVTPRAALRIALVISCLLIVANLVVGGLLWIGGVHGVAERARNDLRQRLTGIEALVARPDLITPPVLTQLSTEITAAEQDLRALQGTLPATSLLGIGPSAQTARVLQLGIDMADAVGNAADAGAILQPYAASMALSLLGGPQAAAQAGSPALTLPVIQRGQQSLNAAKASWQNALAEWHALAQADVADPSIPQLSQITSAMRSLSTSFTTALTAASAMLDWSPTGFGLRAPRDFLLVLQNPDVLRPTGGELTHYALLTTRNGLLVSGLNLQPIAALDCRGGACPPRALPPARTWFPLSTAPVTAHNANLDPDLSLSSASIFNHFSQETGIKVADMIVVTPGLFADVLDVIGPVTVAGIPGAFTARNVLSRLRELHAATPLGAQRDAEVLLTQAIMARLATTTPDQRSALGHAVLHALATKDLQLFGTEQRIEASFQQLGFAGQIQAPVGDSLAIVDTNVGGAPINPAISELATDAITLDTQGGASHHLEITYRYDAPQGGPTYTDVVRVIIPNAAEGGAIEGPCTPLRATQALHAVLACQLTLAPGATAILRFSWNTLRAWDATGHAPPTYALLLQRQPGASLGLRVTASAPDGRVFASATAPGQLASGQLTFATRSLLSDMSLRATLQHP